MSFSGVNRFANDSDAAVRGVVTSVSSPRYNSADGSAWREKEGDPTLAYQYRNAVVRITAVWYSSVADAAVGKDLSFVAEGDGQPDGDLLEGVEPPTRYGESSGPLAPGDHVILVLVRSTITLRDGTKVPVITLKEGLHGNWRDRADGTAENRDPRRSLPTARLQTRLVAERAAGRKNLAPDEDQRTAINPIADEQ